ncbi:MAG TPA: hypothetical protein PLE30_10130 [Candidatus Kapabacteria bacterium]|nr:hypothetical protein [Candidatus Kapabacteria bacterium]
MRLLFYIILACFNLFCIEAFAQRYATPIDPAGIEVPMYLGATIGFGQNFQNGSMYVDCANCEFLNGNKFNFTAGIYLERQLFEGGYLGFDALFSAGGLNSSFKENEIVEVNDQVSNFRENVTIPFRHTADLKISDFSFVPYVKYEPFSFMYLKFGVSYNSNLSATLTHTKELLIREVTLSNGVITKVELANTKGAKAIVQDGDYKELEKSYFALNPTIGLNIPFGETNSVIFSPWLTYVLPLSNMATNSNDFKINKWHLMLSLGFKL